MLQRSRKESIVSDLKSDIEKANAIFLTNLVGIPSNDANQVRKAVREANGKIVITRNTLIGRAATGTRAEALLNGLKGPRAVAFAFEDAPGVAKALYEAGKELDLITLEGGFLGEQELSREEIIALAKLPSRDQMLATVLATFNAPIGAFARVLNAIKEKKEEGGEVVEAKAEATEEQPKAEDAPATEAEPTNENKDNDKKE